jgi:hypothetical protein
LILAPPGDGISPRSGPNAWRNDGRHSVHRA